MSFDIGNISNLLTFGVNTAPLQAFLQNICESLQSQQASIEFLKSELAQRCTAEEKNTLERDLKSTKDELLRTREELLQYTEEKSGQLQNQINESNSRIRGLAEISATRDELNDADRGLRNHVKEEKDSILAEVHKNFDFAKDTDARGIETQKEVKESRERINRLAADAQSINVKIAQTVQRADALTDRVESVVQMCQSEIRQMKESMAVQAAKVNRSLADTQKLIEDQKEAIARAEDGSACLYQVLGLNFAETRTKVLSQMHEPRDVPFLRTLDDRVTAIEKDTAQRVQSQLADLLAKINDAKSELASQKATLEELLKRKIEPTPLPKACIDSDTIFELQKQIDGLQAAYDKLKALLDKKCGLEHLEEKASKTDLQISIEALVQQMEAMHASQMRALNAPIELDGVREALRLKADKKDLDQLLSQFSQLVGELDNTSSGIAVRCLSCHRRVPGPLPAPSIPSVDLSAQFAESVHMTPSGGLPPPTTRGPRSPSPAISQLSRSTLWESTPRRPQSATPQSARLRSSASGSLVKKF